jgi:hypothetical protein
MRAFGGPGHRGQGLYYSFSGIHNDVCRLSGIDRSTGAEQTTLQATDLPVNSGSSLAIARPIDKYGITGNARATPRRRPSRPANSHVKQPSVQQTLERLSAICDGRIRQPKVEIVKAFWVKALLRLYFARAFHRRIEAIA